MAQVPSRPLPHRYDASNRHHGVLLIYTGGTIGSLRRDPFDPASPLVVCDWTEFRRRTSSLSQYMPDGSPNQRFIGFNIDACTLEPVDSCNIGPGYWGHIATIISESYNSYSGFVVLHGTDTMVYTASALSFMLMGLTKPVVLTGAQLPHLNNVRNDALQNLLTALIVANPGFSGLPVVPEVTIFFHEVLLRGNRSRKINASGFNAFESPNYPPLGTAGESIVIAEGLVRRAAAGPRPMTRLALERRVVVVHLFPGIQEGPLLERTLADEELKGVVLMAYGAGTVPGDDRIARAIESAIRRGVVVVAVTQCGRGSVDLSRYEASARLRDAGVIGGADMTPEAAMVKLMVLLGDRSLSRDEVRRLMSRDIAGEITAIDARDRRDSPPAASAQSPGPTSSR